MSCNKKIIISIISTLIISAIIGAFLFEFYLQSNKYDESVIQTSINSKIMGEERDVIIHLPEDYEVNTTKKYPVMYVLDGTSQDIHTAFKIDILSKVKLFPQSIVVGIPNTSGNRSRDFTPHYMKIDIEEANSDLGNGDNFLKFIETELIPYINSNYRQNGFSSISGNSRGGLFTLYALLERPELFDAYMCYSPAFWREDHLIVNKAKAFFNSEHNIKTYLFMSLGDLENDKMKNGYNAMVSLINGFNYDDLDFKHQITRNANHQSNSYKSTVYALEWLGNALQN